MIRNVGPESLRMYEARLANGFFHKYARGVGLDIGYAGSGSGTVPILPSAIGIDKNFPSYNGISLPFREGEMDYVYTSHCLEHIADYKCAIAEWHRVLKIGGYLIIIVPHQYLYEKSTSLPSRWNADHKRFYTPSKLLCEIEESLIPNSYRIRLMEDGDSGFNYKLGPDQHSDGQYEIVLVLEKISPPAWDIK